MLNLLIKDYSFSKKSVFIVIAYCIVFPIILLIDNDGKYYFADFLLPFAAVSAPVGFIMNMEDSKTARRSLKLLPYSSEQKVGARYLFAFSILFLVELYLCLVKPLIFKSSTFINSIKFNLPIFILFGMYYSFYLMVFYWKGYHATQYCLWIMIIIVCFGSKILSLLPFDLFNLLDSNQLIFIIGGLAIIYILFKFACIFDRNRCLDV